jgi:mannitol/fructose-specific phosphotransferase system IIA component
MNPHVIAEEISKLKRNGDIMLGLAPEVIEANANDVETAFYRIQQSEDERLDIIKKMTKKKDNTFAIDRIHKVQVFDALYFINKEFNTTSKYMFYAKAVGDHAGELCFGLRKE